MGASIDTDTQPESERQMSLATAYRELEEVLEAVDFAEEPEFADETIAAIAAIDRAYHLTVDGSVNYSNR